MQTEPQSRPRIAVIGGGLAGLAAAALLARDGAHTILFERSGAAGGRARTTDVDGYRLNLGPHALATDGPGTAVLADLGIDLSGGNPLRRPPRFDVDGRVIGLAARRRGGPGLRLGAAVARLQRQAARNDEPAGATVGEWLDAMTGDAAVRGALGAIARLAVYAQGEEAVAADVLAEALRGGTVRYLDGGWQVLVDRLRATAVGYGVEVRGGVRVERVRTDAGRVTGVDLSDGDHVEVDGAVLAVGGPSAAAELLDGPAALRLRDHAEQAVPARMACLDVALSGPAPRVGVVLGVDAPTYLSEHSQFSALTPGEGAVIQVARFLPPGGRAHAEVRSELEALLDRVVPDWRGRIVHARYLPGLTVTHDLPTPARGGLAGRATVDVAGIAGLAVAGDWVGPHGTLAQAALASAAAAAARMAGRAPARQAA